MCFVAVPKDLGTYGMVLWHMKPICSGSVYIGCMAKVTVRLTFLLHACQKKTGAWPGREAQAGYFVCMKVLAAVLVKVRNINNFCYSG